MKITKARKEFKDSFGQANHFLITTLVALNAIERKVVTEKDKSFSTSWNPKNAVASAKRSRIFVLKSFLGMAVVALEMYMTELNRKPKLLQDHIDDTFLKIYSGAGQSIFKKVTDVADQIQVDPVLTGLMEVLITWRNYSAHYDIDNDIRESSWEILVTNKENIKNEYNGLDIVRLKETYKKNKDFSFKETASLISATQKFVEAIDSYVIENLDQRKYVEQALEVYFENDKFFQRFKSTSNKKEYLESVIIKSIGLKELTFLDNDFIDKMKLIRNRKPRETPEEDPTIR